MRGRFITFEGIDGTGKSTQLFMLADRLRQEGYDVLVTKEPGSLEDPTGLASELRQILFHTVKTTQMVPGVADCLFLADHLQHVGKVVEPALEKGLFVLSDRYADSEFAYGASDKKATPGYLLEAYRIGYGPIPDVTVLFVATEPDVMLERSRARRGEQHQIGKKWNNAEDQRAIQQAYLTELVGQPRTLILTVSPNQTPGQIFEILWDSIQSYLSRPVDYIEGEQNKVIEVMR